MHFSITAITPLFLALAAASPVNMTTSDMGGLQKRISTLCVPPDRRDADNGYIAFDVTDSCERSSWADCREACVILTKNPFAKGEWNDDVKNDLVNVVHQQVALDGQWTSAKVGMWTSTFGLFTTAIPVRDVKIHWINGINRYNMRNPDKMAPYTVILRAKGDAGYSEINVRQW
jgi:hypothetical protein